MDAVNPTSRQQMTTKIIQKLGEIPATTSDPIPDSLTSGIRICCWLAARNGIDERHKLFQHELLAPHPKPHLESQNKVCTPHFLGKCVPTRTHVNYSGGILVSQNGVPNGPFWATKCLVYCFSPARSLFHSVGFPEFSQRHKSTSHSVIK